MSDQAAFQEIDDAVRQDDLKAWWKRWGTMVVVAAVLAVVGAAAVVGWRQYDASRRAQASTAYSVALSKIGQDNNAARAELEKLAESAPDPYRWMAALTAAQLRPTPEEQIAALLAVVPKLPSEFGDLATVIAGYRSVGTSKEAEVAGLLQPLVQPERAFRASALEIQGLAALRRGDLAAARKIWNDIVKDSASPQGEQQRAQALLTLHGAGDTAPAEAKPTEAKPGETK